LAVPTRGPSEKRRPEKRGSGRRCSRRRGSRRRGSRRRGSRRRLDGPLEAAYIDCPRDGPSWRPYRWLGGGPLWRPVKGPIRWNRGDGPIRGSEEAASRDGQRGSETASSKALSSSGGPFWGALSWREGGRLPSRAPFGGSLFRPPFGPRLWALQSACLPRNRLRPRGFGVGFRRRGFGGRPSKGRLSGSAVATALWAKSTQMPQSKQGGFWTSATQFLGFYERCRPKCNFELVLGEPAGLIPPAVRTFGPLLGLPALPSTIRRRSEDGP